MSTDGTDDVSEKLGLEGRKGFPFQWCKHGDIESDCEICRDLAQFFKGLRMMLISGIVIAVCVAALITMNGNGG